MRPEIADSVLGPSARGASAKMLKSLLRELGEVIASKGIPIDEWLNPGLDSATISNKLEQHDLGTPEELTTLYGWHNGFASNLGARAIPRFPFSPLEIALENYEVGVQVLEKFARDKRREILGLDWGSPPGFLPLISDNYTIAVDCQGDPANPPQIHFTFPEFWETPNLGRAVSLCTMVTFWLEGIESGAHEWDPSTQNWILHQELLPPLQKERFLL